MIQSGARLSSLNRELKPREKDLRKDLLDVLAL